MATESTRIDELLKRWESTNAEGEPTSPEELCRDCPELLPEVRQRIEDRLETRPLTRNAGTQKTAATNDDPPAPTDMACIEVEYGELRFHRGGGLGYVFHAQDRHLHREVALKFIQGRYADDEENRDRFLREAEVTARLEHPGVVPVHGIGETSNGQLFYAMRFIHGDTFEAAIDRYHAGKGKSSDRRMEFRNLLNCFVSVCHTIAYAHNRGIVHRDLKPPNILLGRFGETLVVDWGLALPVGRDERARASGEKTLLPKSGSGSGGSSSGAGTPAYMSPEQAEANTDIGPAADIYSLGVVLYKILAGLVPFGGANAFDIIQKVKQGVFSPPSKWKPDVPKPLEAICLKAMSRSPEARYATALELGREVERWLADEPVSAYPERPAQRLARWGRRHKTAVVSGIAGLALVALVALLASLKLGNLANDERQARERGLLFTAKFAARTLASEMDLRWRILEAEANDAELRQIAVQANAADGKPLDPKLNRALHDWLERRYHEYDKTTKASNWFFTTRQGVLTGLAGSTSVPSATFMGKNFAGRDWFHGQGKDLTEEEGHQFGPIQQPHRSVVYRSKGDKKIKVAFSVPVRGEGPDRPVIAVLAMSVELGHFGALQTELGANQLAVLVDTRPDKVEDESRAGLVLHHRRLVELQLEGLDPPAYRVAPDFVDQLTRFTRQRLRQEEMKEQPGWQPASLPAEAAVVNLNRNYQDPVGESFAGPWLAVYEPVIVKGRRDPNLRDTGWVVIIQERP